MAESTQAISSVSAASEHGFVRAIGLFDGTMIVVGSMIGSGIFIVAADISRQTGSPGGLLLTWILTGLLTISAALSYGELAALFPHAGGQYVYLREAYSPLWGFLYGWTLFLVIQTGTIAAVAVGFARYLGVLFPAISPQAWIVHPISLGSKYAISLSVQQLVGVLMILFLTFLNTLGVRLGKLIQNIFTSAKTLSLVGLILLGIFVGKNAGAISENFSHIWTIRNPQTLEPGANFLKSFVPTVTAASGAFGLFVAFCVAQVGSLFSADAWNNIGFTAAEVKNPKRDVAFWILDFRRGKTDVVPGIRGKQGAHLRNAKRHEQTKRAARRSDRGDKTLQEIRAWFQCLWVANGPDVAEILADCSRILPDKDSQENQPHQGQCLRAGKNILYQFAQPHAQRIQERKKKDHQDP